MVGKGWGADIADHQKRFDVILGLKSLDWMGMYGNRRIGRDLMMDMELDLVDAVSYDMKTNSLLRGLRLLLIYAKIVSKGSMVNVIMEVHGVYRGSLTGMISIDLNYQ